MNKTFSRLLPHHSPHHFSVRVYYEDTDFTGLVYHANYLRFAERGRSEYLRALGITHPVLLARRPSLAFVVRRISADFHEAARVDDSLVVATSLVSARGARLEMVQEILRDDTLIWRAILVLAMIKTEIKTDGAAPHPVRIPADLMALFEASIYKVKP